ncbi:hypothetical protein ACIBO5_23990 [Nonomuraea angiospora]|uniref:hypothetical protein n=1 Tax=Nonomuraea angiospora TaxID=46172 RepID=UPI0029B0E861|nr:hypothetical protein [Nonomuraea angiospora]MDX3108862.1 hypothetical protein [Nonomuraea angiospora]
MVRGRHRRPSRGGVLLTAEQLAVLALVGTVAAACSTIIDIAGAVKGDAPTVVAGPTVTVTAPLPEPASNDCGKRFIAIRVAQDSTIELPLACMTPLGTFKIS